MNAFIGPKVRSYIDQLESDAARGRLARRSADHGLERRRRDAGDGGRAAGADAALRASPPACSAAPGSATLSGRRNLITFDIGGTSADIGIVTDGGFARGDARDTSIAGFPLLVPMIDIHTIGAGGGSIAYRRPAAAPSASGRARAGAVPGPAAYGRGGTEPTVTDANVVLGPPRPRQTSSAAA